MLAGLCTHPHTHTERERERERDAHKYKAYICIHTRMHTPLFWLASMSGMTIEQLRRGLCQPLWAKNQDRPPVNVERKITKHVTYKTILIDRGFAY